MKDKGGAKLTCYSNVDWVGILSGIMFYLEEIQSQREARNTTHFPYLVQKSIIALWPQP